MEKGRSVKLKCHPNFGVGIIEMPIMNGITDIDFYKTYMFKKSVFSPYFFPSSQYLSNENRPISSSSNKLEYLL